MPQAAWRRLSLEIPIVDAEPAGALLAAVTGAAITLEQLPRARTLVASAYVRSTRAGAAARELRAKVKHLQANGLLQHAIVRDARVRDEDWSETWKRYSGPLQLAAGLYVAPTWERSSRAPGGVDVIRLDPGMAFGTGRHATTQLAARLLLPLLERTERGANRVVVDAGCGSGILGIAAALRGARVYAFDKDPLAVRIARANFARNSVRAAAIVQADRIPREFPRAAFVVANINAAVLQRLAPEFARTLTNGGVLVSSGLVARTRLRMLFAFAQARLAFARERRRGEWFAYMHRKGGQHMDAHR